MPIKKIAGRQELVVTYLNIGFADPTTYGVAEPAIDLPGNAVIVGGDVVVTTAWNSATTATLKLGDALLTAQTGTAATAGAARIAVQYYVIGRSAFTQG